MKIVLFGPPGSGKGTQAEMLIKTYKIPRIVTGEILRERAKTSKTLQDLMQTGDLVPDDMICGIVAERLQKKDCKNGYILDGFPRTVPQAKYLDSIGVVPDVMFSLHVPDKVIIERLSGRRTHEPSGRIYNIHTSPPKVENKDDITGEALMTRQDDNPTSVKHRLTVYRDNTEPVIEFYKNSKTKVIEIKGDQDPKVIFSKIRQAID